MMNFTARDLSACESATGHLQLENAKLGEETKGRRKIFQVQIWEDKTCCYILKHKGK